MPLITNKHIQCPSCTRNYSEGYRDGYGAAIRVVEREFTRAHLSRPIIMRLPKGAAFISIALKKTIDNNK